MFPLVSVLVGRMPIHTNKKNRGKLAKRALPTDNRTMSITNAHISHVQQLSGPTAHQGAPACGLRYMLNHQNLELWPVCCQCANYNSEPDVHFYTFNNNFGAWGTPRSSLRSGISPLIFRTAPLELSC